MATETKHAHLWQDWGPQAGDRALVNASVPGATVGGNSVALTDAVVDAAYPAPAGGESSLSDDMLELAGAAGDALLERTDCPDQAGFEEELAMLPQADRDVLARVLLALKPDDDPNDVALKYEDKASIPQTLRAQALVRRMPAHMREWLNSFVEREE